MIETLLGMGALLGAVALLYLCGYLVRKILEVDIFTGMFLSVSFLIIILTITVIAHYIGKIILG